MRLDLLQDFVKELESAVTSCAHHPVDLPLAGTLEEGRQYYEWFSKCKPEARARHMRTMALKDLWFLGRYVLGWFYADHPFQFARAREVQANPNGYLDLWSRGHMKSHWITFGLSILDILNNPEITIGIFSHNRPIAKSFLRVIKQQFETNDLLKDLFPDILWRKPEVEAPKWSEDEGGIVVKRKTVRLEGTVEAWGMVDGQPTSRHFDLKVYDDVVTDDSVTTSETINKTTLAWELSLNLSMPNDVSRYAGTFYHENDTYHTMIERGAVKVRRYPIFFEDGPDKGKPQFFTAEQAEERRSKMGPRTFALQCLLDPKQDTTKDRWDSSWIQRYNVPITGGVNVYILVDPANERKASSDYTVIAAIGLGPDRNYYVLDLVRDRLNLKQRTDALIGMHQKFNSMGFGMMPKIVGYEKYGKDSDIEHIEGEMDRQNYRFRIIPLGGIQIKKRDRINKLQPIFQGLRWYMPLAIYKTAYDGQVVELVSSFIQDEYVFIHNNPKHDDMMDCFARILDPKLGATFPVSGFVHNRRPRDYDAEPRRPATWMGV